MPQFTIKALDPDAEHRPWDAFVGKHPRGSVYHLAGWRQVIWKVFRQEQIYLQAIDGEGMILGVLPMVRQKSMLFGHRLLSMPYFNYGGPLGDSDEIETALMEHAGEVATATGAASIEFRDMIRRAEAWPCRDEKVQMILELPESPEAMGQKLGSKRRSQIRRARKEDPEILRGGVELLDDFHEVFAITMRDLGTPVYPRKFFARILETFPENSEIISIRMGGSPVSAGLLIHHARELQIPWAGTLRAVNKFSINMLLYWEVIEKAILRGFERFDFGRTTIDSSTFKFKKQWCAEPRPMYWHYWLAPGEERPKLNPDNPRYKRAIAIWQKLPLPITKLVGPHLVKNLP